MSLIRNFRELWGRSPGLPAGAKRRGNTSYLLLLASAAAFCAHAQTAFVSLSSPSNTLLVGNTLQLSAGVTDLAGTPMDASGLAWSTSDSTIGTITPAGVLQAIVPGDLTITASDANSGASAAVPIHIVPLAFTMQPTYLEVVAGATSAITAVATDASGKPISAAGFQFQSGESSIAMIAADGTVTGVAEGFVTIEARIAGVASDPALVATTRVHVLPAPLYKIRKLLSTETAQNSTVTAYQNISAESASEVAAIASLANGAQAAVLIENGKQKVLAVTGQAIPGVGRMVMRIDGISANARGDVAILVEYPTQWCNAAVVLFPHGAAGQEIAAGNCSNGVNPRSVQPDGAVLYRINDQILRGSAAAAPKLLFSVATQPAMPDPVRNVNDFYPSRNGAFILNTNLVSGAHAYLYFDGKSLSRVYTDGDSFNGRLTNNLGTVVGSLDGTFYAAAYGPGWSGLVKLAPGGTRGLIWSNDPVPGGRFGWVQNLADAGAGGVLLTADLNVNQYHTGLSVWDGANLTEYTPVAGYGSLLSGAILPSGAAIASVTLTGDTDLPLRTFGSDHSSNVMLPGGAAFPQPVPPNIDWHYAPRGVGPSSGAFRGEGDAIVTAGSALKNLAAVGSILPNGKQATWIGGAMANESGDLVFTAGYSNGNGFFRYRAGTLDTIIDQTMQGKGPNGTSLNWANSWRGRYLAMNNRGDAVLIGNFNTANQVVFFGSGVPLRIAQQNLLAPSGAIYTNLYSVAIDDSGRVMFLASTSDGKNTAYFWDGKTVQAVIGTGDPGPWGFTINEISNVAGSGSGFLIMIAAGNYQTRELRYFDGAQMTVVQSTDTTTFDGFGFNYYWSNECTLAANGEAHCMAATQDGDAGVFAHRSNGRDVVVARSRDRLPTGESMVVPLSVSSGLNGDVYFTAEVYKDGAGYLALYQAVRQ